MANMWHCTFRLNFPIQCLFWNLFSQRDLNPRQNESSYWKERSFDRVRRKTYEFWTIYRQLPTDSFDTTFFCFKCKWICVVYVGGDNDEYCLDNSIDNEYARAVSGGSPMHWSVKQDSLEGDSHCRVVIQKCGVKESPRLPVSSRCIDGLVKSDERRFLGRVWSNRSISPRFWPNSTFWRLAKALFGWAISWMCIDQFLPEKSCFVEECSTESNILSFEFLWQVFVLSTWENINALALVSQIDKMCSNAFLFATEYHPAGLPCWDLIERCLLDEVPRHFDHVPSVGFPGSVQMVNVTLTTGR